MTAPLSASPPPPSPPSAPSTPAGAAALRPIDAAAIAALSIGAAVIHLAMVPVHAGEWRAAAVAFAIVGWLQLVIGIALLVRRDRTLATAAIVLSTAVVVAWVVSRTTGFPIGPNAGEAEEVGEIDLLAAAFEILTIAVAWLALRRPAAADSEGWSPSLAALAAPPMVLVIGLTSAVLASPSASDHGVGGHGHDDGSEAPLSSDAHIDADAHAGAGHPDEAAAGGEQAIDEFGLAESAASHGHGDGQIIPNQPIDDATRDALAAQLTTAREVALRHPTVADAEAAGYRMVTTYIPLIGAHYINFGLMDGTFDVTQPEMLLYDGTTPDAEMVGLSYYVVSGAGEPDGFAGPNDHWHQHIGLCIRNGVVVGGEGLTEAECAARGGFKADGADGWMVHAWVVPGWESQVGVFSAENPDLT
jgi:hypothetical protein